MKTIYLSDEDYDRLVTHLHWTSNMDVLVKRCTQPLHPLNRNWQDDAKGVYDRLSGFEERIEAMEGSADWPKDWRSNIVTRLEALESWRNRIREFFKSGPLSS